MSSISCLLIGEGVVRSIPWCIPLGRDWLLQLFSGTVGAVIGAVVAALAAVWVLNRTNSKQQELWDASNEAQKTRDAEAARELRYRDRLARTAEQSALSRQLRAQQDGIDETFRKQAEQASFNRQTEAVSKHAAHTQAMTSAVGKDLQLIQDARDSALQERMRLNIELYGKHDDLIQALTGASQGLFLDAFALHQLFQAGEATADDDPKKATLMDLLMTQRATAAKTTGAYIRDLSIWLAQPSRRSEKLRALKNSAAGSSYQVVADSGYVDLSYVTDIVNAASNKEMPLKTF